MRPWPRRVLNNHPSVPPPPSMEWAYENGPGFIAGPQRVGRAYNAGPVGAQFVGLFQLTAGKWYHECTVISPAFLDGTPVHNDVSNMAFGVARVLPVAVSGGTNFGVPGTGCIMQTNGVVVNGDGGDGRSTGLTYAVNDIAMILTDLDDSRVYFGKNGTWPLGTPYVSGGFALVPGAAYYPCAASWNTLNDTQFLTGWAPGPSGNGAGDYDYTPPAPASAWIL